MTARRTFALALAILLAGACGLWAKDSLSVVTVGLPGEIPLKMRVYGTDTSTLFTPPWGRAISPFYITGIDLNYIYLDSLWIGAQKLLRVLDSVRYGDIVAPWWENICFDVGNLRNGTSPPSFTQTAGSGIFMVQFAGTGAQQDLYGSRCFPSGWDNDSVDMDIHWRPTKYPTGAQDTIVWHVEFQWLSMDSVAPLPETLTVAAEIVSADSMRYMHTEIGTIRPIGVGLGSEILVHIWRNSGDALDTYIFPASFLHLDIHFRENWIGSRTQDAK